MRNINPVGTTAFAGGYSDYDKVLQMIFYSDISAYRTARIMKIAEDDHRNKRAVIVLTESDHVEHLAAVGFLIFRPETHGLDADVDGAVVVDQLRAGNSVVINTNLMEQADKNKLVREINRGLSTMDMSNLTIIIESTEAFYPRRRSRGDSAGMHAMNNLLKRAKNVGAHVVFGAESPQEIALEISNSCGTPIVGVISNEDRAMAVGKAVDRRLSTRRNEMFGIMAMNPDDFYVFNRYTASRPSPLNAAVDLVVDVTATGQIAVLPSWLPDQPLVCGFDPKAPKRASKANSTLQVTFQASLEKARADKEPAPGKNGKASATAPVVANDNGRTASKGKTGSAKRSSASTRKLEGVDEAQDMLKAAGVRNAATVFGTARVILRVRNGRINMPLNGRITAKTIAQRVISDPLLQEAARSAVTIVDYHKRDATTVVSGAAYAAAYYQALLEDADIARAFHVATTGRGDRNRMKNPSVVKTQDALAGLGRMNDADKRREAQFQFVTDAWQGYLARARDEARLPKAA